MFINSIIFILNKELQDAFISETEYEDYMQMVYDATNQILVHHPALLKEVEPMMSSVMKLPSDYKREIAELKQENAELKKQLSKYSSDYE